MTLNYQNKYRVSDTMLKSSSNKRTLSFLFPCDIFILLYTDLSYDGITDMREKSNGRILARFPIITLHTMNGEGQNGR